MALTAYEKGEVAQLDFTVRDLSGVLADPATVTAEVRLPDGTTADITSLIQHLSTGTYRMLLELNNAGDWNVEVVTTTPDDTKQFALYVAPDWVTSSALNPDALTSLSKARLHVLRDVTQDQNDELLALYINGSSTAIANYCNREFKPTDNDTRIFNYDGEGQVSFSPYELRSLTSVITEAEGTTVPQTVPSSLYALEPASKTPEHTYLGLRLAAQGGWPLIRANQSWWLNAGWTVTITGDWGMAAVPADVEMACLVAVADAFRNPGSFTSYSTAGGFTAGEPLSGPSGSLPIGARRLLYPYRRQKRVGAVRLYSQRSDRWRLPIP